MHREPILPADEGFDKAGNWLDKFAATPLFNSNVRARTRDVEQKSD
jgi:hypothetical protein